MHVYFLIIAQFSGDLLMCVKSSLEECTGKEIIYLTQNFLCNNWLAGLSLILLIVKFLSRPNYLMKNVQRIR